MQSEHERYLVEKKFKKPVILTDYPKGIKAFYMRMNEDGETVRAMDILFPGIGEIVGGSQREERLDKLQTRMDEMDVSRGTVVVFGNTKIRNLSTQRIWIRLRTTHHVCNRDEECARCDCLSAYSAKCVLLKINKCKNSDYNKTNN